VFVFNMHVVPDNDRCVAFDRQRLEIKTDASSPAYLKGFLNESVAFRWRFRLPQSFQPSSSFTHIHQIKAGDGDADAPILTLTARKSSPDQLQLIWSDGNGGHGGTLTQVPLAPFVGTWVEAFEQITYSSMGKYSVTIQRVNDGATLLQYTNENLNLWREGATFVRPKWGIYRSLNNSDQLRDEQVRYARFCLAKGADDCLADGPSGLSVQANQRQLAVDPGASAAYNLSVAMPAPLTADLQFGIAGLPAGATGSFNPATVGAAGSSTLTIGTSRPTLPGVYQVLITASNAIVSTTTAVTLSVSGAGGTLPSITAVSNGASFMPGLSGNAWMSITGANLASTTRTWTAAEMSGAKLPTQLDGVSVTFNGEAAPLYFVSPGQLNVLVPSDIAPGPPVVVQVTTRQGVSSTITSLQPVAPAFFVFGGDIGRYVAGRHGSDNVTIGKPGLYPDSRPAAPGEIIVLYGTGFGATFPAIASGQTVTRPQPIANAINVTIGGVPAEVMWAGLSATGLNQINLKVPANLPDGDARITARIAGIPTQENLLLTVRR
jgi:uncharacterized protein (TIGR03437 family)